MPVKVLEIWKDRDGDWSFTKVLITYLVGAVTCGITFGNIFVAMMLSAAFGKSTWEKWLDHLETKMTSSEDISITENISKQYARLDGTQDSSHVP